MEKLAVKSIKLPREAKTMLVTYLVHKVYGLVRTQRIGLRVVFRQNHSPPAFKIVLVLVPSTDCGFVGLSSPPHVL